MNAPQLPGNAADALAPGRSSTGEIIQCAVSESFAHWLSQAQGTLAITTYQAGKVALVGWDGRQVSLLLRQFDKPLGLAARGPMLALATRHEVMILADAPLLAPDYLESDPGRYDALYVPRASYDTGDINVHDLAFANDGLWLVNTRFSCLAAVSDRYNFVPRWKPPFVTEIVPEDRCHLNGLALVDGRPRYVTCLGQSDMVGGWRDAKATGGLVLDVDTGEAICRGLAMPHSPRWHDGWLYVLNSGLGELWRIAPATGACDMVCALPGYLRGLHCWGPYALVGMCQIREKHIFGGLPIEQRYPRLLCGVALVDLRSGAQLGLFEFTAGCQELFEVQFLPGVLRPMLLNRDKVAARQAITAPDFAYWLRPSNEIREP